MKRTILNFVIDVIAFVGFVLLTTTGVLMRYLLPPGSGYYSTIWGLDRHQWGNIHFWISVAFFAVLAFHLVLHWRWVISVISGRASENSGFRVGLGIVGLLASVALAMSPLLTSVEKDFTDKQASFISGHKNKDISIQGSMTLKNIEETTGVPTVYIIKALELPEIVSTEERLGSLKRKYGIEMKEVRDIVKQYKKETS